MEDLSIGILFILTCFGAFASTATHDAKTSKELSELDKLFIDKIHEIEKRYDESLETLRNELMQDNEILRKSVDELNTKLEIERKESSYAIQQLEKDFSEKETKLTKGINGFTDHLVRERSIGDRKTGNNWKCYYYLTSVKTGVALYFQPLGFFLSTVYLSAYSNQSIIRALTHFSCSYSRASFESL